MTTWTPPTERPWEPPFAGTDPEHLVGALDRMRTTFRWKADGLDSAGLQQRVGVSTLRIGGLLKHLAANEDFTSLVRLRGAPLDPAWDDNGWDSDDDWEFSSAAEDSPDRLYGLYDGAVARARQRFAEAVEEGGLERRSMPRTRTAGRSPSGASCSTCSRSTAGTPVTSTCCARPSTAGRARTLRTAGNRSPAATPSTDGRSA